MALKEHLAFAESKSIDTGLKFPELVVELVSTRPSVFAEAIDSFPELRSLIVQTVHSEFFRHTSESLKECNNNKQNMVILKPRETVSVPSSELCLPLPVILSISVVLSTWVELPASGIDEKTNSEINALIDALMRIDVKEDESDNDVGLASAVLVDSGAPAISVESVRLFYLISP